MQILHSDLMWLVGLYEGEGHFGMPKNTPVVFLRMTDYEVVNKAASILQHNKRLYTTELPSGKTAYSLQISGSKALEIMKLMEPYMCARNALRIRKILERREYHIRELDLVQVNDMVV